MVSKVLFEGSCFSTVRIKRVFFCCFKLFLTFQFICKSEKEQKSFQGNSHSASHRPFEYLTILHMLDFDILAFMDSSEK